jgi:hypothetical protein
MLPSVGSCDVISHKFHEAIHVHVHLHGAKCGIVGGYSHHSGLKLQLADGVGTNFVNGMIDGESSLSLLTSLCEVHTG